MYLARIIHDFRTTKGLAMVQIRCASFRFPVCSLIILAAESLNVWKHCGKAAGILAVIIPTIS